MRSVAALWALRLAFTRPRAPGSRLLRSRALDHHGQTPRASPSTSPGSSTSRPEIRQPSGTLAKSGFTRFVPKLIIFGEIYFRASTSRRLARPAPKIAHPRSIHDSGLFGSVTDPPRQRLSACHPLPVPLELSRRRPYRLVGKGACTNRRKLSPFAPWPRSRPPRAFSSCC